MSNCNPRYKEIHNLKQLQDERARIHALLEVTKDDIAYDFEGMKTMLRPANLKEKLVEECYSRWSVFRSALNGFYSVKSLFRKKKKNHYQGQTCNCGCHCTCDCQCGCHYD